MQQLDNAQILYSSSDLTTFLGCPHATFLDLKNLTQKIEIEQDSAMSKLLHQKGIEHEIAYLESLKKEGKAVVEIPKYGSLKERAHLTKQAIQAGADVIYQAVLYEHPWRGDADFLIKCDIDSKLGNYSYEVLDTKLAHIAEPKHIIQLCLYSDLLTNLQGKCPEFLHLFLGDEKKYSFKVADFFYYYIHAKKRLENYLQSSPTGSSPEPCSYCKTCKWESSCKQQWNENGHLSLVANIQSSQIDKLRKAGIKSVAELVTTNADAIIPDLNNDVFERIKSQASLQMHKIKTGEDKYEILESKISKGFSRIPKPVDGDLFFDMEGDPLYPKGLEYLFGIYYREYGNKVFKPFWAHDHEEEKYTFEQFMSFIGNHLKHYPSSNIYHYNHYETTALKRLACRYAICEEQLDNLLRQQKFIDLYLVVKESIRTSEPGYSIKNLETFYMDKRVNAVATAADSIIVYNEWRKIRESSLLQHIADYNEVDCVSTYLLRDWLLSIKPKEIYQEQSTSEDMVPLLDITEEAPQRKEWEIEYEEYRERLLTPNAEVSTVGVDKVKEHLSHLLEFHKREEKPQWWNRFDRQNKLEDEIIDDTECIGGLIQLGLPEPEKRSLIYTYKFPAQEYKLKVGSCVDNVVNMDRVGTIVELDEKECIIKIKRGANREALPERLSIGPEGPIDSKVLRAAIYRYADHIINNQSNNCIKDLLARSLPRIKGRNIGEPVVYADHDDLHAGILEAIVNLDNSYLFIQGPPGAGKTYAAGHMIIDLIRRGKKIGITSNSHKAINNLLARIEDVAREKSVDFQGIKKANEGNEDSLFKGQYIRSETKINDIQPEINLYAGTAWFFANEVFTNQFDYLFIDEAGQVALANFVAVATSAKNVILMGDQMQLGQPVQGTHPGEAGSSVLEFLLGEHATIPLEQGIFLSETRRLTPNICGFISDAFYDGRLTPHESNSQRCLDLINSNLPNEGIVMIPLEHFGCSQKSIEEGNIIKATYHELLGQNFKDKDGSVREITKEDILVVAPYNVQVNYLRSILPINAKVGTVDKFQGQEALIVLISMVTSSAEDLPRNIEFLYSKNRLNVAISRAQCLTVIVANSRLLEIPCNTIEHMKLVNTFCWLNEYAKLCNVNNV